MLEKQYTDIILLLGTLCKELQTSLAEKGIGIFFTSQEKKIALPIAEAHLQYGFSKLIQSIIDFVPDSNSLFITVEIAKAGINRVCSVKIRNTGINLKLVSGIVKNSSFSVTIIPTSANETMYEVCFLLTSNETVSSDLVKEKNNKINYTQVVRGIQSHFSKLKNPIERIAEAKPKEAAFLLKVNRLIAEHIEDEQFDANALSSEMAMSRAQLLRKMKSLIGNSPGYYIKAVRLQKAKELLETDDITISEAAFKTGFGSPSNFTKVFTEKFGITPSQLRRSKPNATNK